MRRIATTLMATCLLFFVACSDEGDVVTIYNGDTFTSDYKASQMFSTLSLYENIARQPEAYDDIVWAAEKFLGTTEIKSMSEKILKYSRLYALEGVTEAVARQPEIVDLFDSFSVKFLGIGIK